MRKLIKAEQVAWEDPPETDARLQLARQPYASREKAFWPGPSCDCAPGYHLQDYRDGLDLTADPRHHSSPDTQPYRWLMLADIALGKEIEEQRSYGIPNAAEFDELLRKVNYRHIEFLLADLDLAVTMAEIAAAAAADAEKRERNTRNARKSYEVVMRLRQKVNATAAQRHQLYRKLTHLHMLLAELGEHFQSLPFAA